MTLRLREDQGHWTAFDPRSGLKVTASPTGERLRKTSAPELADVSVTDYCTVGCAFCYRGSTPQGGHAHLEDLALVAALLAQAGTLEVALGGGEITEHPQFVAVVRTFARAGLVTNFTTRRPERVTPVWADLERHVGALAISSGSAAELRRQHAALENVPAARVNVHVVLGTIREQPYLELLREAHRLGHRVTLLGYKTTERGAEYPSVPYPWWLSGLRLARELGLGLSIDTALSGPYEQALLAEGVAPQLFHTREGQYSVFIDAVRMTVAASSYGGAGAQIGRAHV